MPDTAPANPILPALEATFIVKRQQSTGMVPRNWLLALLVIVDKLRDASPVVSEDDLYTYDFTLKHSRGDAIPKLLTKYAFPINLGLGREGITVRGAPGFRFFRDIGGGSVLADFTDAVRIAMLDEAVEVIRGKLLRVLGQRSIELPSHLFDQTGTFVPALLEAVANRSNGRVEQALVGAKLHLRYHPAGYDVESNPGFAADRQTGREADYDIANLRVIVSVSPKSGHFESAMRLADAGRQVALVVSERAASGARKRIRDSGYLGRVTVQTVEDYVTNNMQEISTAQGLSAREVCLQLVAEYNRRIVLDNDRSLQVIGPTTAGA